MPEVFGFVTLENDISAIYFVCHVNRVLNRMQRWKSNLHVHAYPHCACFSIHCSLLLEWHQLWIMHSFSTRESKAGININEIRLAINFVKYSVQALKIEISLPHRQHGYKTLKN